VLLRCFDKVIRKVFNLPKFFICLVGCGGRSPDASDFVGAEKWCGVVQCSVRLDPQRGEACRHCRPHPQSGAVHSAQRMTSSSVLRTLTSSSVYSTSTSSSVRLDPRSGEAQCTSTSSILFAGDRGAA
jgi:hypothetical protein